MLGAPPLSVREYVMAEVRNLPWQSRKAVDRAGRLLCEPMTVSDEELEAYGIVERWRTAHQAVIAKFREILEPRARAADHSSLVVARLKRIPTMIRKLGRYPDMKLSKMQDIGGLRAVVGSWAEAQHLKDILLATGETPGFRHLRTTDYVTEPKESGYRSIHLVYSCCENTEDPKLDGLTIELQIRTRIQHAWATANEVAGTFLRQDLKSGLGDPDWLRFFVLAGAKLANVDGTPMGPDVPSDRIQFADEFLTLRAWLNVVNRLGAYNVTHQKLIESQTAFRYVVLAYDLAQFDVRLWGFGTEDFGKAVLRYRIAEKEHLNNPDFDTVLVEIDKLADLEAAFPNYFADTEIFTDLISETI